MTQEPLGGKKKDAMKKMNLPFKRPSHRLPESRSRMRLGARVEAHGPEDHLPQFGRWAFRGFPAISVEWGGDFPRESFRGSRSSLDALSGISVECGWEIHGNLRESSKGPGVKFLDSTFRRSDHMAKISGCHLLETDTHRFGEAETLTRLPVQYRAEQSTAASSEYIRVCIGEQFAAALCQLALDFTILGVDSPFFSTIVL